MINNNTDIQKKFEDITKEIEKNLPEKLKNFRLNSRLTTAEVGQYLNKTPSAVSMWETGKAFPDVLTLFKLRELYKIQDLNEFFDTTESVELKSLAKSEQELIDLWRKSPYSVRASIKNILKHII